MVRTSNLKHNHNYSDSSQEKKKMTIFLCSICFSICAKMQGFIGDYVFFLCVFYTEIQDSCQRWRENDFWEKSPVDSAETLWVKNFVQIVLSRTVIEINTFLPFMKKFKMAAKNSGKTIFGKSHQYCLQISCGSKISTKSRTVSEINAFLRFTQKFKRAAKNGGEKIFGENVQ